MTLVQQDQIYANNAKQSSEEIDAIQAPSAFWFTGTKTRNDKKYFGMYTGVRALEESCNKAYGYSVKCSSLDDTNQIKY